jgi:enoyl-CoA hydratase
MNVPGKLTAMSVERQGHVARVTLLGPGAGNAMGPDFFRELPLVFGALDAERDVRAIVLTGSGGHFSYGLDLYGMRDLLAPFLDEGVPAAARSAFLGAVRELQASVTAVADCRTPVIAAVSGWCIGGGVDLASAADVRLASAEAMFSVRETRMAIVADLGSLQRLAGIIGDGHLRELALTGRDIGADRAERIGLVNDVYPDPGSLLDAAHALAEEMARNSPLVLRGVKDVLDAERGRLRQSRGAHGSPGILGSPGPGPGAAAGGRLALGDFPHDLHPEGGRGDCPGHGRQGIPGPPDLGGPSLFLRLPLRPGDNGALDQGALQLAPDLRLLRPAGQDTARDDADQGARPGCVHHAQRLGRGAQGLEDPAGGHLRTARGRRVAAEAPGRAGDLRGAGDPRLLGG